MCWWGLAPARLQFSRLSIKPVQLLGVVLAPRSGLSNNAGIMTTVKLLFEVRAACVEEGEEVRITGNTPSLGSWDIFSSVQLNRSTE